MPTWDDYKAEVRARDPEAGKQIDMIEEAADLFGPIIMKRNELGWSQKDLAEKAGLAYSTIADMESGASYPKLDTLIKVCRALGLKLKVE